MRDGVLDKWRAVSSRDAYERKHASGVLFITAKGMEIVDAAPGAKARGIDVGDGNAGVQQLEAIGLHEVEVAGSGFTELRGDVRADLVAAFSDAGSYSGVQAAGARAEFFLHHAHRGGRDAAHGTAPSGMHGGHGAVLFIDQEDGDAVRRLDGQEISGCVVEQGVAITEEAGAAARRHADGGVDLVQGGEAVRRAGRVAGAESVVQPGKTFQGPGAIDVAGVFVEHYAGFWIWAIMTCSLNCASMDSSRRTSVGLFTRVVI